MLQLEQTLNFTAASTMLSLMAVALASLILPATLYTVLQKSAADTTDAILGLSRGVAIILLVLFCIYQYFQQKSPANFFHVEQPEEQGELQSAKMMDLKYFVVMIAFIFLITILIGMMSVCADNLVGSIDSVLQRTRITQGFIGFVFLPMVGSTAAPSKAVITAYNNGLDRAIDVVITNVMQITLFVMPSVVLLGWAIDQPMQLEFGFLETLCFFLGVFVVSLLVHDRKINYLGGAVCIAM
jgi:Ca2+:H+ antiporter